MGLVEIPSVNSYHIDSNVPTNSILNFTISPIVRTIVSFVLAENRLLIHLYPSLWRETQHDGPERMNRGKRRASISN